MYKEHTSYKLFFNDDYIKNIYKYLQVIELAAVTTHSTLALWTFPSF